MWRGSRYGRAPCPPHRAGQDFDLMHKHFTIPLRAFSVLALLAARSALADMTYHPLSSGPFSQDWSDPNLLTVADS